MLLVGLGCHTCNWSTPGVTEVGGGCCSPSEFCSSLKHCTVWRLLLFLRLVCLSCVLLLSMLFGRVGSRWHMGALS